MYIHILPDVNASICFVYPTSSASRKKILVAKLILLFRGRKQNKQNRHDPYDLDRAIMASQKRSCQLHFLCIAFISRQSSFAMTITYGITIRSAQLPSPTPSHIHIRNFVKVKRLFDHPRGQRLRGVGRARHAVDDIVHFHRINKLCRKNYDHRLLSAEES